MKKILLIIPCLLCCMIGYTQSLTFHELFSLYKHGNPKAYLIKKSFDFEQDKSLEMYFKNRSLANEEKVYYDLHGISYMSRDTAFVNTQIKLIKKQFPLLIKDNSASSTFYQFGNTRINIMVSIEKQPNSFGTLSVANR